MSNDALASLSVLIVEDESLLRKQIAARLEQLGADVTGAGTLEAASNFLDRLDFDFVLLDVNLPDGKGTSLLEKQAFAQSTGVIVMTADGGLSGAVEAMKLGALDYLVKPFDLDELPLAMAAARRARQSARIEEHRRASSDVSGPDLHFGHSLRTLEQQLEKILEADARMRTRLPPVLIEGETGTGKTTLARWIHHRGPRASQPLVEMNCSALPEALAESELFGHERGAFTDARAARMGLFEAADGGTLFLDELPSLAPALQAKVLKAVEDHRIRRLGGRREIPIDVRIIAATNQDLARAMADGRFREDLYHRLNLYRLVAPPLRERREDLPQLADLLIQRICRRHRLPRRTLTAQGKQRLLAHHWPGNIRELSHAIERAIVFEDARELSFDNLASESQPGGAGALEIHEWLNPAFVFPEKGFVLEDAIAHLIRRALDQTGNNVSAAARLLGVSRDYLRYRLAERKDDAPGLAGE